MRHCGSWSDVLNDRCWCDIHRAPQAQAQCSHRQVQLQRTQRQVQVRTAMGARTAWDCGCLRVVRWCSALAGAGATDMAVAVPQRLCCTQQQLNGYDTSTSPLLATSVENGVTPQRLSRFKRLAPNVLIGLLWVTRGHCQRLNCDAKVNGRPNQPVDQERAEHSAFRPTGSLSRRLSPRECHGQRTASMAIRQSGVTATRPWQVQ